MDFSAELRSKTHSVLQFSETIAFSSSIIGYKFNLKFLNYLEQSISNKEDLSFNWGVEQNTPECQTKFSLNANKRFNSQGCLLRPVITLFKSDLGLKSNRYTGKMSVFVFKYNNY